MPLMYQTVCWPLLAHMLEVLHRAGAIALAALPLHHAATRRDAAGLMLHALVTWASCSSCCPAFQSCGRIADPGWATRRFTGPPHVTTARC